MQTIAKKVEYVAGFLFHEDRSCVLLIQKTHPTWQKGRLNGIGGHIEYGETPEEAMRREFREETGVDIKTWEKFVTLKGDDHENWRVYFFRAFDAKAIYRAKQITDEAPMIVEVDDVKQRNIVPNLRWLVPMALTREKERAREFIVQEVY